MKKHTSTSYLFLVFVFLSIGLGCAAHQVETSKAIYEKARFAQDSGNDLEAIGYWKKLVEITSGEIEKDHHPGTNRFMRAVGKLELGMREEALGDLKELNALALRKEEYWIDPLYAVLMGDYYTVQGMYAVAEDMYQSVLKKSSLKSSVVYMIALERYINNSIRKVEQNCLRQPDPDKCRTKEYERMEKEMRKFVEEFPFSGISHMLLADLLMKTGNAEESLEHLLVSVDLGLPGHDLQSSVEFQIAMILKNHGVPSSLKKVLLEKAVQWWSRPSNDHILEAGDESGAWLIQESGLADIDQEENIQVRYLGIRTDGKLEVLVWERRLP